MSLNSVQPVFHLVLALSLSACAAGNASPATPEPGGARSNEAAAADLTATSELGPQTLAPGECGTFFWTADSGHRFVVFENEMRGYAQIFINGSAEGFSSPRREGMHAAGDPYLRRFVDPERNLSIEIDGRIGDPMPMGQRIDRVVMRIQQPDDTLLVMPLIGHYACR